MATSVENVVSMIATSDQVQAAPVGAWKERAAKFAVVSLAVILLFPMLLTFAVLALLVARLCGVPIGGTTLPVRAIRR